MGGKREGDGEEIFPRRRGYIDKSDPDPQRTFVDLVLLRARVRGSNRHALANSEVLMQRVLYIMFRVPQRRLFSFSLITRLLPQRQLA